MPAGSLPSLSTLGEFGLIRQLQRRFGRTDASVRCGIGDDAAIVRPLARRDVLITTDVLVEGVHFQIGERHTQNIGYKAAAANLSDIAAMGGTPHYLLVAIAIPASRTSHDIERLYEGIMSACRRHQVQLIGGDTSASRHGLFISITLIGSATPGQALRRDGARRGDLIYVTGTLGDSLAGLKLTTRVGHSRPDHMLSPRHRRYLIERHERPTPRLQAGQLLSARGLATAAIDISDGLAGDLSRLCEQSHVGAALDEVTLPCSPALLAYGRHTRQDPMQLVLRGGEDYELLFTVRRRDAARVKRFSRTIGCQISCIGAIQPRRDGLRLRTRHGTIKPLAVHSYEHF